MRKSFVMALLAAAASGVIAAPFQNGSFEVGTLTDTGGFDVLSPGSTAITGWTVIGDGVDYIGGQWLAANGTRSLDMLSCGVSGGVQQTFDTVPGAIYTVSFSLAGNPDGGSKTLTVSAAGGTSNYTFDTTGASSSAMNWSARNFSFVAQANSTTLSMLGGVTGGAASCAGSALDNVAVTLVAGAAPPVPVGGAFGAAALLAALGAMASRRRKNR